MTGRETTEYLGMIQRLETLISNKQIERKQAQELAVHTTALFPGRDNDCNEMMKRVDMQLTDTITLFVQLRCDICETIQRLPTAEYDVLHKCFVQGMSIEQAAEQRKQSYQWTYELRKRGIDALKNCMVSPAYAEAKEMLSLDREQNEKAI